jgi:hypothetical protein
MTVNSNNFTMPAPIDLALAELRDQPVPKFVATAEKYAVNITTLRRRFAGTQLSYQEAREQTHNRLTLAQEEVLIRWIDEFTERHMPPTSQLVKNVAEEIVGGPIGRNWVGDFTRRYKDRLHQSYLRIIDAKRIKAENPKLIKRFYDQVSSL